MVNIIRNADDIDKGLAALLTIDRRLETVALIAGPLPLRLSQPGFAGLAHIIVSQVVSRASADAIWRRMVDEMEVVTEQNYLAATPTGTPQFGLSRAKAKTLHGVARAIENGSLDLGRLNALDEVEAFDRLTALDGIGPWTAKVYLMFCGGHADIFPSGDVALQAAVAGAFQMDARPSPKVLAEIAMRWSPYRSIAARLFWAYYASTTRREAVPIA